MNRLKRLFSTLLAFAIALTPVFTFSGRAFAETGVVMQEANDETDRDELFEKIAIEPFRSAESIIPEEFNEHDYNALLSFLETVDSNGIKNGSKLWENYSAEDPSTWESIHFDADGSITGVQLFPYAYDRLNPPDFPDEANAPVGSLDLSNCESLYNVSIDCCLVESVDFSGCTNLETVSVTRTACRTYSVEECINCWGVIANENPYLTTFDVSTLDRLGELCVYLNGIETLQFGPRNSRLMLLECIANRITELDTSCLPSLSVLYLSDGDYLCPVDNVISELNLSSNPELTTLVCNRMNLSELDLSHCPNLRVLSADDCPLEMLNISGCTMLYDISVARTNLDDIDLTEIESLERVNVYGIPLGTEGIERNISIHPEISDLNIGNTGTTAFDSSTRSEFNNLILSDNPLINVTASASNIWADNLTSLENAEFTLVGNDSLFSFNGTDPEKINVEAERLTAIYCSGCDLNELPDFVLNSMWLRTLDCSNNNLTGVLDTTSMSSYMSSLNCSNNPITELNIGEKHYQSLDCTNTKITSLHIENGVDSYYSCDFAVSGSGYIGIRFNRTLKTVESPYGGTYTAAVLQGMLIATPESGNVPRGWSDGDGNMLSQGAEYEFEIYQNSSFCAHFADIGDCPEGDADGDGRITIADANYIARHALGLAPLPDFTIGICDVNNDDTITIADAVFVMRIAMGLM